MRILQAKFRRYTVFSASRNRCHTDVEYRLKIPQLMFPDSYRLLYIARGNAAVTSPVQSV